MSKSPKSKKAAKRAKKAPAKKAATKTKSQGSKRSPGRPTKYSAELAEELCRRLWDSPTNPDDPEEYKLPQSLVQICRDPEMPNRSTVHDWLSDKESVAYKAGFPDRYAHARELRKDSLVERLLYLSCKAKTDAKGRVGTGEAGAKVQAYKLEIDTIKWVLSKEYSHHYGDLLKQELSGPNGGPIETTRERDKEEEERFAAILANVRKKIDKEDK